MDKFTQSEMVYAAQMSMRDWASEVSELRKASHGFTTGINVRVGLDNKMVFIPDTFVREIAKDTQEVIAAGFRVMSARYEKFIAPE